MPDYFTFSPSSPAARGGGSPSATSGKMRPVFDWTGMMTASASSPGWTPQEAFFAVLFSAAVCDGGMDAVEQDVLIALIHRSRALKSLSDKDLEDLNSSVTRKLHGQENDALEEACRVLPSRLRLPLFAQALDIILADGDLSQDEAAFLNRLAAYLDLAENDVRRVADVMILKNTA